VLFSENGMVDLGKKKRRYSVGSDDCLYAFEASWISLYRVDYHMEWTINFRKRWAGDHTLRNGHHIES